MTVLSDPAVAELGAALYAARRAGLPIEPLTDTHSAMSVTDAYRVQRDLVARLLADGDRVVGYKLGLTSAPMQRMLGVDSPDFAPVLASHLHPDGAEVAASGFIHPRVEAEIALVLGEDLAGPDCTALDVARAGPIPSPTSRAAARSSWARRSSRSAASICGWPEWCSAGTAR